jgi:hypothetical protein
MSKKEELSLIMKYFKKASSDESPEVNTLPVEEPVNDAALAIGSADASLVKKAADDDDEDEKIPSLRNLLQNVDSGAEEAKDLITDDDEGDEEDEKNPEEEKNSEEGEGSEGGDGSEGGEDSEDKKEELFKGIKNSPMVKEYLEYIAGGIYLGYYYNDLLNKKEKLIEEIRPKLKLLIKDLSINKQQKVNKKTKEVKEIKVLSDGHINIIIDSIITGKDPEEIQDHIIKHITPKESVVLKKQVADITTVFKNYEDLFFKEDIISKDTKLTASQKQSLLKIQQEVRKYKDELHEIMDEFEVIERIKKPKKIITWASNPKVEATLQRDGMLTKAKQLIAQIDLKFMRKVKEAAYSITKPTGERYIPQDIDDAFEEAITGVSKGILNKLHPESSLYDPTQRTASGRFLERQLINNRKTELPAEIRSGDNVTIRKGRKLIPNLPPFAGLFIQGTKVSGRNPKLVLGDLKSHIRNMVRKKLQDAGSIESIHYNMSTPERRLDTSIRSALRFIGSPKHLRDGGGSVYDKTRPFDTKTKVSLLEYKKEVMKQVLLRHISKIKGSVLDSIKMAENGEYEIAYVDYLRARKDWENAERGEPKKAAKNKKNSIEKKLKNISKKIVSKRGQLNKLLVSESGIESFIEKYYDDLLKLFNQSDSFTMIDNHTLSVANDKKIIEQEKFNIKKLVASYGELLNSLLGNLSKNKGDDAKGNKVSGLLLKDGEGKSHFLPINEEFVKEGAEKLLELWASGKTYAWDKAISDTIRNIIFDSDEVAKTDLAGSDLYKAVNAVSSEVLKDIRPTLIKFHNEATSEENRNRITDNTDPRSIVLPKVTNPEGGEELNAALEKVLNSKNADFKARFTQTINQVTKENEGFTGNKTNEEHNLQLMIIKAVYKNKLPELKAAMGGNLTDDQVYNKILEESASGELDEFITKIHKNLMEALPSLPANQAKEIRREIGKLHASNLDHLRTIMDRDSKLKISLHRAQEALERDKKNLILELSSKANKSVINKFKKRLENLEKYVTLGDRLTKELGSLSQQFEKKEEERTNLEKELKYKDEEITTVSKQENPTKNIFELHKEFAAIKTQLTKNKGASLKLRADLNKLNQQLEENKREIFKISAPIREAQAKANSTANEKLKQDLPKIIAQHQEILKKLQEDVDESEEIVRTIKQGVKSSEDTEDDDVDLVEHARSLNKSSDNGKKIDQIGIQQLGSISVVNRGAESSVKSSGSVLGHRSLIENQVETYISQYLESDLRAIIGEIKELNINTMIKILSSALLLAETVPSEFEKLKDKLDDIVDECFYGKDGTSEFAKNYIAYAKERNKAPTSYSVEDKARILMEAKDKKMKNKDGEPIEKYEDLTSDEAKGLFFEFVLPKLAERYAQLIHGHLRLVVSTGTNKPILGELQKASVENIKLITKYMDLKRGVTSKSGVRSNNFVVKLEEHLRLKLSEENIQKILATATASIADGAFANYRVDSKERARDKMFGKDSLIKVKSEINEILEKLLNDTQHGANHIFKTLDLDVEDESAPAEASSGYDTVGLLLALQDIGKDPEVAKQVAKLVSDLTEDPLHKAQEKLYEANQALLKEKRDQTNGDKEINRETLRGLQKQVDDLEDEIVLLKSEDNVNEKYKEVRHSLNNYIVEKYSQNYAKILKEVEEGTEESLQNATEAGSYNIGIYCNQALTRCKGFKKDLVKFVKSIRDLLDINEEFGKVEFEEGDKGLVERTASLKKAAKKAEISEKALKKLAKILLKALKQVKE